jgi:hypothetical protein
MVALIDPLEMLTKVALFEADMDYESLAIQRRDALYERGA